MLLNIVIDLQERLGDLTNRILLSELFKCIVIDEKCKKLFVEHRSDHPGIFLNYPL